MKPAPLHLNTYFLTNLQMSGVQYFVPKEKHQYNLNNLESKVEVTTNKQHPGVWQVILNLKYTPQPKENVPYSFGLHITGFFEVHPNWPKAKTEELVQINGPAVLFGAAREILAQVTSRGPWGQILLPTVNFLPEKETKNKKSSESHRKPEKDNRREK